MRHLVRALGVDLGCRLIGEHARCLRARATASRARCWSPPESIAGRWPARPAKPSNSSKSEVRRRRFPADISPASSMGGSRWVMASAIRCALLSKLLLCGS